jgi:hypothetical protein
MRTAAAREAVLHGEKVEVEKYASTTIADIRLFSAWRT